MDAFLLHSGLGLAVIAAVAGLQHWTRRSSTLVPAEFGVDPALTAAIEQGFADHSRRATY